LTSNLHLPSSQMSATPISPILPRLPGVRDCDYRKIVALPTVVNLPEADFDMWRRAVRDKARLIVLGRTVIETVTIEFLFKIRPRLNEDQLQVHCSWCTQGSRLTNTAHQHERDNLLSTNNLVDWVIQYRQRNNPLSHRLANVIFSSIDVCAA
jgi:hypothetical protein